jgi:hypothetical protein
MLITLVWYEIVHAGKIEDMSCRLTQFSLAWKFTRLNNTIKYKCLKTGPKCFENLRHCTYSEHSTHFLHIIQIIRILLGKKELHEHHSAPSSLVTCRSLSMINRKRRTVTSLLKVWSDRKIHFIQQALASIRPNVTNLLSKMTFI